MNKFSGVITATLLCGESCGPVIAHAYPAQTIRMIAGVPPGGGADVMARLITPKMTEAWSSRL